MPMRKPTLALLLAVAACRGGPTAGPPAADGVSNLVCERAFESAKAYADPFNEVELDVLVTAPDGVVRRVPAFWAGGRAWRVRYASPQTGLHRFRTVCSDAANASLHGVEGAWRLKPYAGTNLLYRHGPLRVSADRKRFEHADGAPFFWLGDTWWMGLCRRLAWPEEFQRLAADRSEKGFNVIQIVAGLYPDMPAFDERGANEAGFPWEPSYARIRPAYFDAADRRIRFLADAGLVPCIVAAWGYHLPWMGAEKMKRHLRYVIARWGALPVVWCAAGEVNLPYYKTPGFPHGGERQTKEWLEVIRYARSLNAFERPLTVHPTGIPPLSGRLVMPAAPLDFDMLQTGHGRREVLAPTITTLRASRAADPPMPVVNGEVSYEALLGTIPAETVRMMFWVCMLSGAAGHTYGANGIWQLNRRGQPYGASPHGGTYGPIPWDEAMALPGSRQVGMGKRLLEETGWHTFEPHPEWAGVAGRAPPAGAEEFLVPYAAGNDRVRVLYAPTADPIEVRRLPPGAVYRAERFDPATGRRDDLGGAQADAGGVWTSPGAADLGHDWVLVIKRGE